MDKNAGTFLDIRYHLLRAVASAASDPRVVRAIPIAFPIIESTFIVEQRVPVSLGLANRFVLDALCRFGPCTVAQLDELLGLGEEVTALILADAESFDADMMKFDDRYSAGEKMRGYFAAKPLFRVVKHRHRFVVNGISGELLSVKFWKSRDEFRLNVRFGEATDTIAHADGTGIPSPAVRAWLQGPGTTGAQALTELIESGDTKRKVHAGVPEGALGLGTTHPEASVPGLVLAFLLVREDSTVDVVAAGDGAVSLVSPELRAPEYWHQACRGAEFRPWLLDSKWHEDKQSHLLEMWPKETKIERSKRQGELMLSVPEPEKNLVWDIDADEANEQRRVREALVEGVWWDHHSCIVVRLLPGNEPTAKRVCVLRAVRALRRALRRVDLFADEEPALDLHTWWLQWQQTFASERTGAPLPELELAVLLDAAEQVNETEFHEKLDRLREGDQ